MDRHSPHSPQRGTGSAAGPQPSVRSLPDESPDRAVAPRLVAGRGPPGSGIVTATTPYLKTIGRRLAQESSGIGTAIVSPTFALTEPNPIVSTLELCPSRFESGRTNPKMGAERIYADR